MRQQTAVVGFDKGELEQSVTTLGKQKKVAELPPPWGYWSGPLTEVVRFSAVARDAARSVARGVDRAHVGRVEARSY